MSRFPIQKLARLFPSRPTSENSKYNAVKKKMQHWGGIVLVAILFLWSAYLYLQYGNTLNGLLCLAAAIFNGLVFYRQTRTSVHRFVRNLTATRRERRASGTSKTASPA